MCRINVKPQNINNLLNDHFVGYLSKYQLVQDLNGKYNLFLYVKTIPSCCHHMLYANIKCFLPKVTKSFRKHFKAKIQKCHRDHLYMMVYAYGHAYKMPSTLGNPLEYGLHYYEDSLFSRKNLDLFFKNQITEYPNKISDIVLGVVINHNVDAHDLTPIEYQIADVLQLTSHAVRHYGCFIALLTMIQRGTSMDAEKHIKMKQIVTGLNNLCKKHAINIVGQSVVNRP